MITPSKRRLPPNAHKSGRHHRDCRTEQACQSRGERKKKLSLASFLAAKKTGQIWPASSFITDKTPWSSPDDTSGPGSLSTGGYGQSKGREENNTLIVVSPLFRWYNVIPGKRRARRKQSSFILYNGQKTQKRASISPSGKPVMLSALYWDVSAEKVSLWFRPS